MYKFIINRLAKLGGFKQAIHAYCYDHQSKSYRDNMTFAFVDSKNRKYFYFADMKQLPLPLLEKLNELQEGLNCKVPGRDLDAWLLKVTECLEGGSNKIVELGYWLTVLKDRRKALFEPKVLTEIAALLYIREDENPGNYNAEIHVEKFNMLWADSKSGGKLYDFFQQAGLSKYIPSQSITAENWQQSLTETLETVERFNSAVSRISTSVTEFNRLEASSMKT